MIYHEPFDYKTNEELLKAAKKLNIQLPFQGDLSPLFRKLEIGGKTVPNRLAVQPMEGADAYFNGSPGELTWRRYRRYAEGGSGLIWFEAAAVGPEGRSNPHQLMLNNENLESFQSLVKDTRDAAYKAYGDSHDIFCVLQLTHSGRYSKLGSEVSPKVVMYNPYLDKSTKSLHILDDTELDELQEPYIETARLAYHAGFDAVDIKSCNGYLLNELLAAYGREHSRYGGGFENRTRFLTEVVHKIHANVPNLCLAVRLSGFDGIPFPYGFGFAKDSPLDIDLTELKALIRRLLLLGCSLFNVTAGNPRYKPHLGRPYDRCLPGSQFPDEHPLIGIKRLLNITKGLQKHFPNVPFVGTGYSWLRQFFPYVGAAVIENNEASLMGLGRSSFAYPDVPRDLVEQGHMDARKVCITCSRCSELLRNGYHSGCVTRDKEIYEKEYQKIKADE